MFRKILVPVDVAEIDAARPAIAAARELAGPVKADVRLITVLQPPATGMALDLPEDIYVRAVDQAQAALSALAEEVGADVKTGIGVRRGSIYHEILRDAEEWGADVIVIGSHRPEMRTYLIGSNAARVARHAPCSVLVLREKG
jgi:nucleotide-binding universal stress UspA family protein